MKPEVFSRPGAPSTRVLDYVEIADRADALPAVLSGGEQQGLAIARALANQAKLILSDEPTAALDAQRPMRVRATPEKVAPESRSAVIVVTHDVRMIEGFDHVDHMKDGRLDSSQS